MMNLFRDVRLRRRSSSTSNHSNDGASAAAAATATPSTAAAKDGAAATATEPQVHASLRRGLMPRSRTTTNDLSSNNPAAPAAPDTSNGGTLSASATSNSITKVTDWSYCRPPRQPPGNNGPPRPKPPSRSASLGRNFSYSRSITMPNFQEQDRDPQSQGKGHQQQFSTFRQHQVTDPGGGVKYRQHPNGGLQDQQQQQQHQPTRRRRPLSAEVSGVPPAVPPRKNSAGSSAKQPQMITSNSEFFRVINDRLQDALQNQQSSSDQVSSLESLLDDDGNYIITTTSEFDQQMNSSSFNSLELFNEADEDAMKQKQSLDSLVGSCGTTDSSSMSSSKAAAAAAGAAVSSSSSGNKSNSLPKSAFGSIQMKVLEIKEQLDVLKTSSTGSQALQKVLPHVIQSSPAPGSTPTPTPPNSSSASSSVANPPPAKSALQLFGLNSYFQSPPGSSQDTDSMSPRSISPATRCVTADKLTAGKQQQLSHLQQHQQQLQQQQNQQPQNGGSKPLKPQSSSSSPSTLSPCSSNSLPSAQNTLNRPQVLKLPQSNSFNCFGSAVAAAAGGMTAGGPSGSKDDSDTGSVDPRDRLIFFFDIMSTQQRIAKVKSSTILFSVLQGSSSNFIF